MKFKLLVIGLLVLCPVLFYGQEAKPHDYMSMIMGGDNFYLSENSKSYIKFDVSKEKVVSGVKGMTDLTPLLRRIEEYEAVGWELFHFGPMGTTGTMALMRKEKK